MIVLIDYPPLSTGLGRNCDGRWLDRPDVLVRPPRDEGVDGTFAVAGKPCLPRHLDLRVDDGQMAIGSENEEEFTTRLSSTTSMASCSIESSVADISSSISSSSAVVN